METAAIVHTGQNNQIIPAITNLPLGETLSIKEFTPRLYQQTILATASLKNTLVVLPTGMGKTNIFVMLAAQRLKQYPDTKILLVGPTRPLIEQYKAVFLKYFDISEDKLAIFTGFVSPEKRQELWKKSMIIFSTPQGLENDIINKRINLQEVSLLGIDEAHRATGDYSYVWIAKQYHEQAKYSRIIAMTASPGSDMEKITEICKNLHIEEIESRTKDDPDVKPYVQEIKIEWISVDLPEKFKEIQKSLQDCYKTKIEEIKKLGYINKESTLNFSKMDLLKLSGSFHAEVGKGNKEPEILRSISLAAEALKVSHGLELLESQGITALYLYLNKFNKEAESSKVKAVKNLVMDINFKTALIKTERLYEDKIEHSKLDQLKLIVLDELDKDKNVKIMVFNQYRDNAQKIVSEINKMQWAKAELFVGQMKKGDTGLSQKKQKEMLDRFRNNELNVLVSTSIGEEGLDIPKVDLVIFYEPVPSAIRMIQRRGRTGRSEKGRVICLMTKNTRDEAYRWSAHHKEKSMHRNMKIIKKQIVLGEVKQEQKQLNSFPSSDMSLESSLISSNSTTINIISAALNGLDKDINSVQSSQQLQKPQQVEQPRIIIDHRERGSGVIKQLIELGADIRLEQLQVGDFALSQRVVVEFKTTEDFVSSLIDGRLLGQLKEMKQNYQRPIVIVEGERDMYSIRNVHPNAIRGMLATIAVSYGIPILYTNNFRETASMLYIIAKREQEESPRDFTLHASKNPMSDKEKQEYIVSSLPNVGQGLAKEMLKKFKTVRKVMNAKQDKLRKVDGVGEKIAACINDIMDKEYLE